MNILFVTASLGVGGAQSFLLRMLSAFPKEHNIYLYDVHPKQREPEILSNLTRDIPIFSSKYERLEIKLKRYPTIFTKILNRLNRHFDWKAKTDKKYFNRIIRKNNIEIINSHMYLADSFVQNNLTTQIPKVASFHGCYNYIWYKKEESNIFPKLKTDIQNILNNYSGIITAADRHNEVFENYNIINQKNIQKIYYGFSEKEIIEFDLKQKYNLPDNAFIFGMVARGDKTKGWQEVIDAFEKLQKEFEFIFLILSGGTEYLENLKQKYSGNTNIIFTGNINNPLDYISNYDVGLLPTYFPAESLPNTVIEYLYCGKPVVATDWAEIPKMIDYDGKKAGEIIPLKNGKADTEKLYAAMKSYLETPEKLKVQSNLAKQAFQKFEMQKCINAYLNFFEKTIANVR
jgi:glycosyltransferase involved in cell wall biosynthesis